MHIEAFYAKVQKIKTEKKIIKKCQEVDLDSQSFNIIITIIYNIYNHTTTQKNKSGQVGGSEIQRHKHHVSQTKINLRVEIVLITHE